MTELVNNRRQKGMSFHKFYTYVYLPLSIVVALFIALGRYQHLTTFNFNTYKSGLEFIHGIFPFISALLSIIALPLLIGKSNLGRRVVLFSETFKSLISLVLIAAYLTYGNVLPAFVYTLYVFAAALVYGYYRVREWEFSEIEEKLQRAVNEREPSEPRVEIKQEIKQEEKEEEKEEIIEEEREEEEKEEEAKEVTIEEESGYDDNETVKITSIIPSTFVPNEKVMVESVEIRTLRDSSSITINTMNISPLTFSSSLWSFDGNKTYQSDKPIPPFTKTAIKVRINVPTDRVAVSLQSLVDEKGEIHTYMDKKYVLLPEKYAVEGVSKNDAFPYFLSQYMKETGVEANWLYTENPDNTSWLCPKCGIPLSWEDEKCPVCNMERTKAKLFSSSALITAFEKSMEKKES